MKLLDTLETGSPRVPVGEPLARQPNDAALFELEPRLLKAHAAVIAALDRQDAADRRYYATRPARPAREELPAMESGPGRLVVTAERDPGTRAAHDRKREAWQRADMKASRAAGLRAAERASCAAEDRLREITQAILDTRATTLPGMALKLRLCRISKSDKVMDSIEADLRALGLSVNQVD